ncbi:MAG: V-type ATP synthase subunit D [Oscillospiraceae bacterium]|nr:V-type ATP synthase subunit D [Oscillospiraceae bacterium]
MARLNVNPTRMELSRLKARLRTARRGHKLLRDKRDELMKQFLDIMRQNRDLRRAVEAALERAHKSFTVASALMSPELMEQSLMYPKQSVSLSVGYKNIMSVNVPRYAYTTKNDDKSDIYPYGFMQTSGELDDALTELSAIFTDMLKLAELEKSVQLLAIEIEKTRRRVNALEYVTIPQLEETIKYITMRLDENERGNLTRLMKVKDMMLKQAGYGQSGA